MKTLNRNFVKLVFQNAKMKAGIFACFCYTFYFNEADLLFWIVSSFELDALSADVLLANIWSG
jgi:hypothetical protein